MMIAKKFTRATACATALAWAALATPALAQTRPAASAAAAAAPAVAVAAPTATAATGADLLIGASLPLSGLSGPAGQEALAVMRAHFDSVNKSGGVQGRRLVLTALDDAFNPAKAAENARRLAEDPKVIALFNCWGTASCSAMVPVANDNKLPLVAGIAGGGALRDTPGRFAFNVRPGTADEIGRMLRHMVTVGQSRVAVVYQNDGFGKGALTLAQSQLALQKMVPAVELPVAADASDVAGVVAALEKTAPQSVLLLGSTTATVGLISQMRGQGLAAPVYNLAAQANRKVVADLGANTQGVIFSTLVPSPWRDALPLVKEYQQAVRTALGKDEFSYLGLEVFLNAKVLVEGLRAAGNKLTREGLVAALETMPERTYAPNLTVKYGASDRNGSTYTGLAIITAHGRFLE